MKTKQEQWREDAQKFIEDEKRIFFPIDLYMLTLAYCAGREKAEKEIEKRDRLLEQAKVLMTQNTHKLSQEQWLSDYRDLK